MLSSMAGIKYRGITEDPICKQQRKLYLCQGAKETLIQHADDQVF